MGEFSKTIPKSQEELFDQCYPISVHFQTFLRKYYYGYTERNNKLVKIKMNRGEIVYERCHEAWAEFCGQEHVISHYANKVGGYIIDWTYKQFDREANFPEIYKANDYKGRWKTIKW